MEKKTEEALLVALDALRALDRDVEGTEFERRLAAPIEALQDAFGHAGDADCERFLDESRTCRACGADFESLRECPSCGGRTACRLGCPLTIY